MAETLPDDVGLKNDESMNAVPQEYGIGEASLAELAADIKGEYSRHLGYVAAARKNAEASREHLQRMTEMLLKARERVVEEGMSWGAWVEKNLPFGERQAQRYLQIGREMRDDPTRVSGESLRGQLKSIGAAVDGKQQKVNIHYSSNSVEWYTPQLIIERVERVLGAIDLDPCAEPGKRIPAAKYFTEEDDGLSREWCGRVFMNPPYGSAIKPWIRKLVEEYEAGRTTAAIALVPSRTDTQWHSMLDDFPRCYLTVRLKFLGEDGSEKDAAPFPSVLIYLGDDVRAFESAFEGSGRVFMPLAPLADYEDIEDDPEEHEPTVGDVYTPHGGFMPGRTERTLPGSSQDFPPEEERADQWPPAPPRQTVLRAPVSRGPGTKWRVAPRIIDLFPTDFRVYVEPYVGTGAMLLSKKPSEVEIVNDVHKEIANLFDVIRDYPKELANAVDRTGYTEADLKRAHKEAPSGLDSVERARRWLVLAHQAFLRQTGKPSFSISTAPTVRASTRLWDELPAHIEAAARRLKGVQVLSRDAVKVIGMKKVRQPDVLLYVDPPYLPGTRTPNLYVYEMPKPKHIEMLEALVKHPGPVYLSGYTSNIYSDRLVGWEPRNIPGYTAYGGRDEVLWLNEKAAEAARAADEREATAAARAERRSPMGTMGMVLASQEPKTPEAPAMAAVFGTLIEGWHSMGDEEE